MIVIFNWRKNGLKMFKNARNQKHKKVGNGEVTKDFHA